MDPGYLQEAASRVEEALGGMQLAIERHGREEDDVADIETGTIVNWCAIACITKMDGIGDVEDRIDVYLPPNGASTYSILGLMHAGVLYMQRRFGDDL